MATMTAFDVWLECNGPESTEEIYCLYNSVQNCEGLGIYTTTAKNGKLFVNGTGDDTLMIASEKAKDLFLQILRKQYCDGMDIESWYAFTKAMENPNA